MSGKEIMTSSKGHYDNNLENNIKMYDKQPYFRDNSICIYDPTKLLSGNIIKNFRVRLIEPQNNNDLHNEERQSQDE